MKNLIVFLKVIFFCLFLAVFSLEAQELSLSARLSQPDGSPLEGVVDLRFELSYSGSPETVICTKDMSGTNLTNGLFQLGLNFSTAECGGSSLSDILEGVPASEAMLFRVVDVTDPANPRTYPFQSLKAVPLSVRSEVAQTLARNSAVEGQVLRFVGGEWTASNETAEVGTVSEINTGAGLTGGPITSSGTIAIANSGVTSAMVADGTLVDADLSATAALARTKMATGTANYVLVNDGSGVMSEIAILPLTSGGTGAANAADARSNLELGNAALRNVGLLAGELLDSGEIPSCTLDEKIRKVVMPVAGFVCESGADATKLPLAGGTMSGNINMNANAITNLADPSLAQDAATKSYVDGQIGGGAANQWSESSGNVYRASGNVGIGTSSPVAKLEVNGSIKKLNASNILRVTVSNVGSDSADGISSPVLSIERAIDIINTYPDQLFQIRLIGDVSFNANRSLYNKTVYFGRSDGAVTNWNASLKLSNSTLNFDFFSSAPNPPGERAGFNGNIILGASPVFISESGVNTVTAGGFYRTSFVIGADNQIFVMRDAGGNGSTGGSSFHLHLNFRGGITNPNSHIGFKFDESTRINNVNRSKVYYHAASLPSFVELSQYAEWVGSNGNVTKYGDNNIFVGNVGIGVTAPSTNLDIAGQIKLRGGSPGAGKVLTSDAAGLATWVAPSTTATPTGAASGDLAGNYPGPVIAPGAVTDAKVAAGANIAQSKIANLTTDLAAKQAADSDLTGLSNLATNGVIVRTGSGAYQTRALDGVANRTVVTNADGVTGNPTIDVSASLLPSPLAGDTTRFLRATGANTTSWQALIGSDITTALGYTPINKAGDSIGSGVFDFNSTAVVRANNPVGTRDVANKSYVDTQVSGAVNQWTASGGNVYRASGNVGIGTAIPNAKLEVRPTSYITGDTATPDSLLVAFSANDFIGITGWDRDGNLGTTNDGDATIFFGDDATDSLRIAYKGSGLAMTELARVLPSGSIGIGTTSPTSKLHVIGDVRATSFISTSDRRLKKDIKKVTGLQTINQLEGVSYKWRDNDENEWGLIAQDLEKVIPDLVVTDESSGYKAVKYQGLFAPMIEAIKDLFKIFEDSHSKTLELEREVASLKKENQELKERQDKILQRLEALEERP